MDIKVWLKESVHSFRYVIAVGHRHAVIMVMTRGWLVTWNHLVSFFRDMISPFKLVKIYPNNKPWVTKSFKPCVQRNKLTFKQEALTYLDLGNKEL